jgi:tellurite resistance protein TehA-like permease
MVRRSAAGPVGRWPRRQTARRGRSRASPLTSTRASRPARTGLPFTLAWWSFTFPVGTVVTGTGQLAVRTGVTALSWLAALLFGCLLLAWLTVAARTVDGLCRGRLAVPVPASYPI